MRNQKKKISLGFSNQHFEPGIHICQIFNTDEERQSALVDFIISGLEAGENTACFSEKETQTTLTDLFKEQGIEYNKVVESGEFALSKTGDVYFKDKKFDPDKMLGLLKSFYSNSVEQKRTGARVIGEMLPDVEQISGGNRLMEYESKVSMLIKEYPINAVCQYDARAFDGSTILDILKVHPYMIIRGSVVHNPFFIQPEEFLELNKPT